MSRARRISSRVVCSVIPWLVLGVMLASACTEKGRSLLLVKVELDASLEPTALGNVQIVATWNNGGRVERSFDFKAANNKTFGVYLPKEISESVMVAAKGYRAGAAAEPIAVSKEPRIVPVRPGETFSLTLTLTAGTSLPTVDGGTDAGSDGGADAPGSGSGGIPGGGGGGGGGSGLAGTGGGGGVQAGGTGGTAAGGTGGPVSSGGAGGRGGMSTGGTAGASNGSGGAIATGGAGGTTTMTWRGAIMVESDLLLPDYTPAVAVDGSGNAVVAYRHGANIRASRYNATTAVWSTPFNIDGRSGGQAYSPSVAVDKNGRWLAVWQQDDSLTFPGIWQSTSTDGMTWSAPAAITTAPGYDPALAMNKDGAAVVSWYDTSVGSDGFAVFASTRISATAAWSAALQMKPAKYVNSFPPHKVAMSGTGEAFVIWEDLDDLSVQSSVWLRRFSGGTWAAATLAETHDGGVATAANIAANTAGQAIITWYQYAGSAVDIMARRYSPSGGLTAAASLGQASSAAWDPALAVTLDEAGVATVAWAFSVQGKYNVYSNRAASGAAWPTAVAMETDNQAALVNNRLEDVAKPAPVLGSDAAGNVVLVWRKGVAGGRFDLWGRRFVGGAWGAAALLETMDTDADGPWWPVLSVGSAGTAVTAWYYQNQNLIWTNVLR